ncbi:MAG TPA: GDSL-type esterase/lipase family protein [Mycobacteriales bacterium]|jgi:lysophospholipase L1-like esterase|nr:GDSL-type esterase/lipase family protein [Mycobacteriales bacterium]
MRRPAFAVAIAAVALAVAVAPSAFAAKPSGGGTSGVALPNSMAATGDSITRAYDSTSSGCFLSDCPQYSWSTATNTSVNSHYLRILAANRGINGNVFNDAKTGAKMVDLDGQAKTAASQGVQYLTVLMGANDLCTSSASTMTPTATFQSQFQTALTDFFAADPTAHVFVSSIPNIYQLWSLEHNNSTAEFEWNYFGICQSMLYAGNTEADRQLVVTQEQADNNVLATVCAQFANCKWDNLATYNYAFKTSDISTIDYFHPSVSGQNTLAGITWGAGYWPSTK